MSFDLSGRKALVTGASRGIGRAIAIAYAQAGADVAITARDEALLQEVATVIEGFGRKAIVVPADVLDGDALTDAVDAAALGLDGLDILVNNAGGNSFSTPLSNMRFSGWQKTFALNVESVMLASQAAYPHLRKAEHASVINVSSVASIAATPFMAHYGAAKSAVSSLTKTMAVEWASEGIRVNALLPGWIETDLTGFMRHDDGQDNDFGSALIGRVPMKRWGIVDEISEPAIFLASSASAFMTGQQLVIDGGLSVA